MNSHSAPTNHCGQCAGAKPGDDGDGDGDDGHVDGHVGGRDDHDD